MSNCRKCGAALAPESVVCEYCGSTVEAPRFSEGEKREGRFSGGVSGALRFKRASVPLMLLFTLCTLGLYPGIWFLTRRNELKQIAGENEKKMNTWINVYVSCLAVHFSLTFLGGEGGAETAGAAGIAALAIFGVSVYVSLFVRDVLRAHAARLDVPFAVAPSAFWAGLFGVFYIQHHANKLIDMRYFAEK